MYAIALSTLLRAILARNHTDAHHTPCSIRVFYSGTPQYRGMHPATGTDRERSIDMKQKWKHPGARIHRQLVNSNPFFSLADEWQCALQMRPANRYPWNCNGLCARDERCLIEFVGFRWLRQNDTTEREDTVIKYPATAVLLTA